MRARSFGPAGKQVPVVGQGSWHLEQEDRGQVVRAVRAGLDLGLTHVDTAEMYGDGEVESILGEALEGRRDEVFLASKVLPQNASRRGTVAACERSLERLRTEVLDLYLLHWIGPHPLEDTIAAFEELVERGRIRSWGVSNFDGVDLDRAVALAGAGRVACNQVLYHLRERAVEERVLPACRRHGVALVAYSPFGAGDFPREGDAGFDALSAVARRHDATPRQAALAFLLRHREVFAVPKATDERHLRDNARAADLELDPDDLARLDAAFPLRVKPSLPML